MSANGFSERGYAYLLGHAIEPSVASELGVREDSGELVLPTLDADGRKRFNRRRSLDGGRAKVRQPRGEPLTLSWLAREPGTTALVCEGESDALAAVCALREAGGLAGEPVSVVSVPGTGFPARRLAEQLAAASVGEAFLAFDADEPGVSYTGRAIRALRAAGIAPVPVILPPGRDLAEQLARDPEGWLPNALADARLLSRASSSPPEESAELIQASVSAGRRMPPRACSPRGAVPAVPSSFDVFGSVTAGLPAETCATLFADLPSDAQRACWNALAAECAEHVERSRLADPDEVPWHRPPRVGRLWGTRGSVRPLRPRSSGSRPRPRPAGASDVLVTIPPPTYFEMIAGIDVPARGGFVRCPIPGHDDRTPSCRVYADVERGWYCHGCHSGGSVYDLGAALWRLGTRGDDFKLLRRELLRLLLGEVV